MLTRYVNRHGELKDVDLDEVVDVVDGWSQIKPGWQGFIVYAPSERQFIELMSALPDVRGNSDSHAAEVDASYVETTYALTSDQISRLRQSPSTWAFIKKR